MNTIKGVETDGVHLSSSVCGPLVAALSRGGGTLMDYQNSEFGSQLFRPEAQVY